MIVSPHSSEVMIGRSPAFLVGMAFSARTWHNPPSTRIREARLGVELSFLETRCTHGVLLGTEYINGLEPTRR